LKVADYLVARISCPGTGEFGFGTDGGAGGGKFIYGSNAGFTD